MDPLNPPALHGEQEAGRAAQVRKQLVSLSTDIMASTLDLAELLVEAQRNGYPKKWGYEGIIDFGTSELGFSESKVMYLMRIVKTCEAVGVKRTDYEKVPVSILRALTTLDAEDKFFNKDTGENEDMAEHIVRLIADGPHMTSKEIKEEVARLKGQTGPDAIITHSYSYTRAAFEETIDPAIEEARKHLGSKGRDPDTGKAIEYSTGVCLEVICANFLSDPNYKPDMKIPTDNEEFTGMEVPREL